MRRGDKQGRKELAELVRFDEARNTLASGLAETAKTAGLLRSFKKCSQRFPAALRGLSF